jgi:hypothetical protein
MTVVPCAKFCLLWFVGTFFGLLTNSTGITFMVLFECVMNAVITQGKKDQQHGRGIT